MPLSALRNFPLILALLFALAGSGWKAQSPQQQTQPFASASGAVAITARLQAIAVTGKLADLYWPDFSDYRRDFERAYESSNFSLIWLNNGQPTQQALAIIQALQANGQKGLVPDDYDASRWQGRIAALTSFADAETQARFDAALTVCAMRYISDLHIGRVNPKHFNFGIDIEQKKYNLPQFITQDLVHAANIPAVLASVEPPYNGYKRTQIALQRYLELAAKGDGPPLARVQKSVAPGDTYSGIPQLIERLHLLGDLP